MKQRNALLWALLMALAGCGSLSKTIRDEQMLRLGTTQRLLVFDAENEVVLATFVRDELQNRLPQADEDIAHAKAQWVQAERDADAADDKDDAKYDEGNDN